MNKELVIVAVLLPPTFPPEMAPDELARFMRTLMGKPLVEATLIAGDNGLMPLVAPLPRARHHHFSLTFNMLVVPFAVVMGEPAARVLH